MSREEQYYVGADIGTTGCRVSIHAASGERVATSSSEYSLEIPRAGWAEQDPAAIYKALTQTFSDALSKFSGDRARIRSLTLSSVFHSIFPVTEAGEPLHPMLIFADSRAQECLPEIREAVDADKLYTRTGCPLHPMYPLAKILWFRRNLPDLFEKTAKFVSIKEFIIRKLSGKFIVDKSIASGTGLFDLHKSQWDPECLKLLGITEAKLSKVESTTYCIDEWQPELIGLPKGIPLVLGAGDGVLSTLGAGATGPGQYTAMIGTSGAVRLCCEKPQTDAKTKNWCYNLTDDVWVVGGAINNGGLALRWARDKFNAVEQYVAEKLDLDPYEVMSLYAEKKPTGSEGLIFLPFLSGERSPHWNANARGVLFGLTLNHGPRHLVRATFEGVMYSMYSVFKSLEKWCPKDSQVEIRVSGSFTRSPFWVQMMADVFGHPVTLPGEPEGSSFGAAMLGAVAIGHMKSIFEVRKLMGEPRQVFTPDAKRHATYQRLFKVYEKVYQNLVTEFDEIAKIQSEL